MLVRTLGLPGLMALVLFPALACAQAPSSRAAETTFDPFRDRVPGIPTSLFGMYIEPGQWMVYPFAEYETNDEEEYTPLELGFPRPGFAGEEEFLGQFTQEEAVLFIGYGISESLAFEFEAELYASARLDKSPLDTSPVPARI